MKSQKKIVSDNFHHALISLSDYLTL